MKYILIILSTLFIIDSSKAQNWEFIGPTDIASRSVLQMDVKFFAGHEPRIGVATRKGIAVNFGNEWKNVLTSDYYSDTFRSVYFSPWNDSVAFVGYDEYDPSNGEEGSFGSTISNLYESKWNTGTRFGYGGWVGGAPSLPIVFSPHHRNKVYSSINGFHLSTDDGATWQNRNFNVDSYGSKFLAADVVHDSVLYAGLSSSYAQSGIYQSTDDGNNWKLLFPLPMSYYFQYDFIADDDRLMYSADRRYDQADSACGIFLSEDQSLTWTQVLSNINVQKITRDSSKQNELYAAAQGGIYRSTDTGKTWTLYDNSLPSRNLVDIRKDPYSDALYAATSDSGVYKLLKGIVNVEKDLEMPNDFSLEQNYPNPFTLTTTINFSLSRPAFTTIEIRNVFGNLITTLVSEELSAGKHEVHWNAHSIRSGVYLCQVHIGNLSSCRKIVLFR